MTDAPRKGGCLRCGCLGCMGLVLLAVLAAVGGLAWGWFQRPGDPRVETQSYTHVAPAAALPLAEAPAGRIRLDLSHGRFEVLPSPAGSPLRIEAEYDTAAFALTESLDLAQDGQPWTWSIAFGSSTGVLGDLFRDKTSDPTVRIHVPRGLPFALYGHVDMGTSRLDLGGLALADTDLEVGLGEHVLVFSEPTPVSAGTVRVHGRMGELALEQLGNASPRETSIEWSMGEVRADLSGHWRNDANVEVRFEFGEARVHVPEDVTLDIGEMSVTAGELRLPSVSPAPAGERRFTIRLGGGGRFGDIEVSR